MSQQVTVVINPKSGEMTLEVNGVSGGSCTDITAQLVKANEQKEQTLTAEYSTPDVLPDYIHDHNEGE
jgi:hypothetical protein